MARMAGGDPYEDEDVGGGVASGPRSPAAQQAANRSMAANNAAANAQQPNFFQQAGDFIFGNGSNPGLLGTGQYDPGNVALGGVDEREAERRRRQAEVDARTAPTLDTTQANQFRDQQMALAGDLLAASRGEGPSVAQEQLRQGTQANLAASVAAANSIRGPGAAAGAGQLLAARANAGQQMASDAALLRANEVTQARGLLGQVAGQGRGMDLDTAQANLQSQQETQRQRDALTLQFMQMGMDEANAQLQADLELARIGQTTYYQTAANRQGLVRDVVGGIGSALGLGAGGGGGGGG